MTKKAKFACYLAAEKNPLFIVINIDLDDWVIGLLKAIAAELKADVKVDDLRLFKTDLPLKPNSTLDSRALEWVKQQPTKNAFSKTRLLKLIYPNGPPSVNKRQLDFIVTIVKKDTPANADLNQILSLNCFVLGDDPDRIFTIEIPKTKNISILKDLIKEKKSSRLKDVDASDLDLWKVDFSMDNLKTKILNFKPDSHPKLLAIKKISIFEDDDDGTINDEHLHVLAKVSDQILSLNCCILGDDPNREFTVEIARTKNVSILKDLIKEKKGFRLKDVDASDIHLWNALLSNRETNLSPGELLLDVFPSGVDNYSLHIIVRVPVAKHLVSGKERKELLRDQVSASDKGANVTVQNSAQECQPGSDIKSSNPE